jgi:phage baseplate assembly protein W
LVAGSSFAVAEQDSVDDIGNCVEAILRCPIGFRSEILSFGIDDLVFNLQPISNEALQQTVASQEPRADLSWYEIQDRFDDLFVKIVLDVRQAGGR